LDAHYTTDLQYAFVASPDALKKLATLLNNRVGNLTIRADCADDASREFTSIRELLAYENAKPKEIRRIHFSARSDDFTKRASIDLFGSQWRGISVDYHARDDVISRLRTDTLDIIEGMRPWYSPVHRVDFVSLGFFAYFVLWFGLLALIAMNIFPESDSNPQSSPRSRAIAQLIIFGSIGLLFVSGIMLNRFRDSVFPRAVFMIGQGHSRFKQLEKFQWGGVIAFVASLVAGVVIAVLQAIAP
jgi:hypothetical protein